MKRIILASVFCLVVGDLIAQRVAYSVKDEKRKFSTEEVMLDLHKTAIRVPQKEGEEVGWTSLLPSIVDVGFKIVTDVLENRKEKFSGEYSAQNSYIDAGTYTVPSIEFVRRIDNEIALRIYLEAKKIENIDGYVYYVKETELSYSKARTSRPNERFDFTIEIKPIFFVGGEKKLQELSPLVINSVGFGKYVYAEPKYRTSIIPLPKGGIFSEISIKIIETNSSRVKVERILSIYSKYRDDAKTIINNFIENGKSVDSGEKEQGKQDESDENQ